MQKKKIGLALGSGGTRGFAHIGVLKVLIEEGIKIDCLVGCSAGAVVGAYYAVHGEIEGLEKLFLDMSRVEFASFVDLISPRKALTGGGSVYKFLDKILASSDISQTKIPLQIVTTDLRKGCEVNLSKGDMAEAVLASMSLPGIFPPVTVGRNILVDGGVVNPTPVDVVKKMGADIILGVDLTMKGNVSLSEPNIFAVIMRSFDVLRTETTKLTAKKVGKNLVIIKPKLDVNAGFVKSFTNRREVIAEGERVARLALPKIRKLMNY